MERASRRRFDLDFDGELLSEKLVSPIPIRYISTGLHRLSRPGKLIQTRYYTCRQLSFVFGFFCLILVRWIQVFCLVYLRTKLNALGFNDSITADFTIWNIKIFECQVSEVAVKCFRGGFNMGSPCRYLSSSFFGWLYLCFSSSISTAPAIWLIP